MTARIIASLVLIGVGSLAIYTIWARPWHPWSSERFDQAFGVPKVVTRVIRGAFGVMFVVMGVIGILRTLKVLSE